MADLETLLTYLTLISVPIGVFYHIMTLNNSRKNQQQQLETRLAQLLMNIINTFNSLEFRTQWHISETASWSDYEDYKQKYPPGSEVLTANVMMFTFFDSIGVLVKQNLINLDLVSHSFALSIVVTWRMYEDVILGDREYFNSQYMWEDFEYIYNELDKIEKYASTKSPYNVYL